MTPAVRAARWPAAGLTVLVAAAAVSVLAAVVRYPGMLDDPDAGLWLALLVAVSAGYVGAVVWAWRRGGSEEAVIGFRFGIAAGVLWIGEVWTQAPARLPLPPERTVPAVLAVLAALTTIAAGVFVGWSGRPRADVLRAGLWAGLVSGALMTVGMIAVQTSNISLLGARADYQDEFAASGLADMATYLASDAVAASTMHLVINVVLGIVGGAVGFVVAPTAAAV